MTPPCFLRFSSFHPRKLLALSRDLDADGYGFDFGSGQTLREVPTGAWQHVAVVRDGAHAQWYLDGEPNGAAFAPRQIPSYGTDALSVGADIRNAEAATDTADSSADYLDGYLAQLCVLNRAMGDEAVRGLYLAQVRRFAAPPPPPPEAQPLLAAAAGSALARAQHAHAHGQHGAPAPLSVASEWAKEARTGSPSSWEAEGLKTVSKREQREKRQRWKERHLDPEERVAMAAERHRAERRAARGHGVGDGGGGGMLGGGGHGGGHGHGKGGHGHHHGEHVIIA